MALLVAVCLHGGAHANPEPMGLAEHLLRNPAATLRSAVKASERGDFETAERLLLETARRHPVIADHADLLRIRSLLARGNTTAGAAAILEALQAHPSSPLRADYYQLLGDARAHFGDWEAARSAWDAALAETGDGDRQAALHLAIARSLEDSGEPRQAAAHYATLWIGHPGREQAEEAGRRLDALEEAFGESLREGPAWRRRGDKLFRKRDNQRALAAYDRALAEGGLSQSEERRVLKQRAHTLFRMRRYTEAAESFAALPEEDEIQLWRARAVARTGDVPRAVAEFEQLAEKARGELGSRARYLAGILLEDKGHAARARAYYQQVAGSRASDGLANAALWRLGWGSYREERFAEAIDFFERLPSLEQDPIGALRARYWRARALEQLDHASGEAAREEFQAIAREFPFSYYGWRSRERTPEMPPEAPRDPETISQGKARLDPADLARPRILLEAGLREEANEELHLSARRARGLWDRLGLAPLFTDAGDYHGAQRLVVDAYGEALARGPVPSLEDLWWYAWPAAYADLVGRATGVSAGVPPELVFAIMREESSYRPAVVSVNGARGLLQIMPTTGERLARETGIESFSVDDLFDPGSNIGLGSHYLDQLSRRFPGRLSAAIASYNAGPRVVRDWVGRRKGQDDDEWVESIPYEQTRAYVKRVMRSLHAYRVLY
jgi:soluble lytic murein transglycosylase